MVMTIPMIVGIIRKLYLFTIMQRRPGCLGVVPQTFILSHELNLGGNMGQI